MYVYSYVSDVLLFFGFGGKKLIPESPKSVFLELGRKETTDQNMSKPGGLDRTMGNSSLPTACDSSFQFSIANLGVTSKTSTPFGGLIGVGGVKNGKS